MLQSMCFTLLPFSWFADLVAGALDDLAAASERELEAMRGETQEEAPPLATTADSSDPETLTLLGDGSVLFLSFSGALRTDPRCRETLIPIPVRGYGTLTEHSDFWAGLRGAPVLL